MTRESPVTSPALSRRSDLQSIPNGHENALQHRILEHSFALQLKKQQQLQQQILLQQFQVQQQQLAQQHEEQLRHHLKVSWSRSFKVLYFGLNSIYSIS
ncbi:histone deacetylase 9-B-like isoform X1 [Nilaparvata lugens]|uniref:histone deacetylase 9-B-like isoform X1 n=1 Tax=Nilaparvata lugens TaxID=108931 RepID=UPI00193DACEA|nr:histone deacetylase 9-B-like isoform X1 [Nilaparvata lugens]